MNAAPVVGALLLDHSSPYSTDTIQVQVVDAVDADGDPLTFQYDWRVNGQLVQSNTSTATTATLDLSQPGFGDRGDLIEVIVTVSDGTDTSSAAAFVTVATLTGGSRSGYLPFFQFEFGHGEQYEFADLLIRQMEIYAAMIVQYEEGYGSLNFNLDSGVAGAANP